MRVALGLFLDDTELSFFLSYPPKSRSLWAVLDDEFAAGLGHASHVSLSRGGVFVLFGCFLGLKERDTETQTERESERDPCWVLLLCVRVFSSFLGFGDDAVGRGGDGSFGF